MKLNQFQSFLHKEIPLTQQMGLQLNSLSDREVKMSAPLAPNINDKGSVFGGSSSALQIICAWSLVKLNCIQNSITADIVIYKNETIWQAPLFSNFQVVSKFNGTSNFVEIKNTLSLNKNVKLETLSTIYDANGNITSEMKAIYVLIAK
jgi:thioesterase domain-containing protein